MSINFNLPHLKNGYFDLTAARDNFKQMIEELKRNGLSAANTDKLFKVTTMEEFEKEAQKWIKQTENQNLGLDLNYYVCGDCKKGVDDYARVWGDPHGDFKNSDGSMSYNEFHTTGLNNLLTDGNSKENFIPTGYMGDSFVRDVDKSHNFLDDSNNPYKADSLFDDNFNKGVRLISNQTKTVGNEKRTYIEEMGLQVDTHKIHFQSGKNGAGQKILLDGQEIALGKTITIDGKQVKIDKNTKIDLGNGQFIKFNDNNNIQVKTAEYDLKFQKDSWNSNKYWNVEARTGKAGVTSDKSDAHLAGSFDRPAGKDAGQAFAAAFGEGKLPATISYGKVMKKEEFAAMAGEDAELTKEEMTAALKAQDPNLTDEQVAAKVNDFFGKYDRNGGQTVSQAEYNRVTYEILAKNAMAFGSEFTSTYDKDKDGQVHYKEMADFLVKSGQIKDKKAAEDYALKFIRDNDKSRPDAEYLAVEDLAASLMSRDKNDDGVVDENEMKAEMTASSWKTQFDGINQMYSPNPNDWQALSKSTVNHTIQAANGLFSNLFNGIALRDVDYGVGSTTDKERAEKAAAFGKQLFSNIDGLVDGQDDGKITKEELAKLKGLDAAKVDAMFAAMDASGNGEVDALELAAYAYALDGVSGAADGKLTTAEFAQGATGEQVKTALDFLKQFNFNMATSPNQAA